MINDITQTIDEIIAFLDKCNMQGWANKYAAWRQEIIENKDDPKKVKNYTKKYTLPARQEASSVTTLYIQLSKANLNTRTL